MNLHYFKFIDLPEDLRSFNKIKSKVRVDCISSSSLNGKQYAGLTNFVNSKGQLFFYKTPCRDFVHCDSKRTADLSLTNNSINLSSLYIEDIDFPLIAYGYPNAKRLLKNGLPNPQFKFRNDAYLFFLNEDYSMIEMIVIPDARNLIHSFYNKAIDSDFKKELADLRDKATPFFNYSGLGL